MLYFMEFSMFTVNLQLQQHRSSIFHLFLNVLTAVPVVPRHAGGGVFSVGVCDEAEVLQD